MTDILFYAEDPGAANYIGPVVKLLVSEGLRCVVVADGIALDWLQREKINCIHSEGRGAKLFLELKPRLLVVGTAENRDTAGLALIRMAKDVGIPSVGVIDAPMNAPFRFSGRTENPLAFVPDYLLVPDEHTLREFTNLGFREERIIICGHPHYDALMMKMEALDKEGKLAMRSRIMPECGESRKLVVFVAENEGESNVADYRRSADYTLSGRGWSDKRVDIVLEEFLDAAADYSGNWFKVLRLHPKNTRDEFAYYENEFEQISQGGSSIELVYTADLVVGMTSMLLQEAWLIGCPVLSVVPRVQERQWLPFLADERIPCVTTREALREWMQALPIVCNKSSVIPYKGVCCVARNIRQMLLLGNNTLV